MKADRTRKYNANQRKISLRSMKNSKHRLRKAARALADELGVTRIELMKTFKEAKDGQ